MNNSLEINSLNVDSNETFYKLLKRRKDLQIINMNRSNEATLYFFDKNERDQFLICMVVDGKIEVFY